jgi:membrane fusion protein (multidrug efflux system)
MNPNAATKTPAGASSDKGSRPSEDIHPADRHDLPESLVARAAKPGTTHIKFDFAVKLRSLSSAGLWAIGLAAGLVVVAAYVYVPRLYFVETDDAYIQADTVSVVPKVGAYVTALHVGDNTRFSIGQLLVELDPRDFQVAVESAEADLQSAQAAKANVQEQLNEQNHVIAAAQASVEGDRATLEFATRELDRYGTLANNGSGTPERWQQAQSDAGQRHATLQHDLATIDAAQAHLAVLQSQIRQADAAIARQQASLAQAQLNLSYTKIYAVIAGSVTNRTVQVGNFVQPGQTLFSAVPNDVYVIANFKETQLSNMESGQSVTVRVDAFPARRLHGHVDSFQRGTGSNFALLPPENATGNFVKVVQRVPVKILIDDLPKTLQSISPGMSVEAKVTIKSPPRWLAPLASSVGLEPGS